MKKILVVSCTVIAFIISFVVTMCYYTLTCEDDEAIYPNIEPIPEIEVDFEVIEVIEQLDPYELEKQKFNSVMDKLLSKQDLSYDWYAEYKDTVNNYKFVNETDTIYDEYSDEDIKYLCRMVETEAHGADFASKVNVANVCLNRIESDKFPNTIKEVVTQPNQFCYSKNNIDEETIAACEYSYLFDDTTNGALYFHSGQKTNTFCGKKYILTDNAGHHFY